MTEVERVLGTHSLTVPQLADTRRASRYQIPGFTFQNQDETNWCWAAVGSEICRARGIAAAQRAIVPLIYSDYRNKTANLLRVLRKLHRTYDIGFYRNAYTSPANNIQLAKAAILRIRRGRPVPMQVKWTNGIRHAICAYGYQQAVDGSISFWIYDPSKLDEYGGNRRLHRATSFDDYRSNTLAGQLFGEIEAVYLVTS